MEHKPNPNSTPIPNPNPNQIVTEMPYVMVICWATITEDAAARAFAQVAQYPLAALIFTHSHFPSPNPTHLTFHSYPNQGFYDAAGSFLALNEAVQVEICSLALTPILTLALTLTLFLAVTLTLTLILTATLTPTPRLRSASGRGSSATSRRAS